MTNNCSVNTKGSNIFLSFEFGKMNFVGFVNGHLHACHARMTTKISARTARTMHIIFFNLKNRLFTRLRQTYFGLSNQSCCYIVNSQYSLKTSKSNLSANQRPNSNPGLISCMEIKLCTRVTRGPSRELLKL